MKTGIVGELIASWIKPGTKAREGKIVFKDLNITKDVTITAQLHGNPELGTKYQIFLKKAKQCTQSGSNSPSQQPTT